MIMPCAPEQAPPSPGTDEQEGEWGGDTSSSATADSLPAAVSVVGSMTDIGKWNSFRAMVELGFEQDAQERPVDRVGCAGSSRDAGAEAVVSALAGGRLCCCVAAAAAGCCCSSFLSHSRQQFLWEEGACFFFFRSFLRCVFRVSLFSFFLTVALLIICCDYII